MGVVFHWNRPEYILDISVITITYYYQRTTLINPYKRDPAETISPASKNKQKAKKTNTSRKLFSIFHWKITPILATVFETKVFYSCTSSGHICR